MNQLIFQRIDRLIQMKATGSPNEFASKLELSRATLLRHIAKLKAMGAPIEYSYEKNSYCYTEPVQYFAGFLPKEQLKAIKMYHLRGGIRNPKTFNLSHYYPLPVAV